MSFSFLSNYKGSRLILRGGGGGDALKPWLLGVSFQAVSSELTSNYSSAE